MPQQRKPRAILLALAALAALALAAPAAFASDARYEGISEDGDVAVFSTTESIVAGDTDVLRDVYVRESEKAPWDVTREVSLGPTGGNDSFEADFKAIDPAGDRVFFSTGERLTVADKDSATDLYVRDLVEKETTLVSAGDSSCAGSGCGTADVAVSPVDEVFAGGNVTFFVTLERLSSDDEDSGFDVYRRDLLAEETTLVSAPAASCTVGLCGGGTSAVVFRGASGDGSRAIFTTGESLSGEDTDLEVDLYERDVDGGETELVSTPGAGEACPKSASSCAPAATSSISPDGSHVFFETNEQIKPNDDDDKQDVYDWAGGVATLASVGEADQNGPADAGFLAGAANGTEVLFSTVDAFSSADADSAVDIYLRTGGSTELVSDKGPSCTPPECGSSGKAPEFKWVGADGNLAVFTTFEPLVDADTDKSADVYSRTLPGGPTALVSLPGPTCPTCGNDAHDAGFAGASTDGSSLFFVTDEALAPTEPPGDPFAFGDSDKAKDVYQRSGGETTLVSLGHPNDELEYRGNEDLQDAQLRAVSVDGSVPFFTTREQLRELDIDGDEDLYARAEAKTPLISQANTAEQEAKLAPPGPTLEATDPESPNAATSIRVIGTAQAGAGVKIYSSSNCVGQPIGTGSAETLAEPGIAVTVGAGTTTTFYATAEADGFVSACTGALSYTQKSSASQGGSGISTLVAPDPGPLLPLRYEVPRTRITFGPAFKTRIRRPVFRFTDATGQEGTRFVCKVDRGRWKSCGSPLKLKKLSRGGHSFGVKGVNAVGVWQEKPSKRKFTVVP
jgi:hypothetical protein